MILSLVIMGKSSAAARSLVSVSPWLWKIAALGMVLLSWLWEIAVEIAAHGMVLLLAIAGKSSSAARRMVLPLWLWEIAAKYGFIVGNRGEIIVCCVWHGIVVALGDFCMLYCIVVGHHRLGLILGGALFYARVTFETLVVFNFKVP
jgi:hypothetical protein